MNPEASATVSVNAGPQEQKEESPKRRNAVKLTAPPEQTPKSDAVLTQAQPQSPSIGTAQHPPRPGETSVKPSPLQTEIEDEQAACCNPGTRQGTEVVSNLALSRTSEGELGKESSNVLSSRLPTGSDVVSDTDMNCDVTNQNESEPSMMACASRSSTAVRLETDVTRASCLQGQTFEAVAFREEHQSPDTSPTDEDGLEWFTPKDGYSP